MRTLWNNVRTYSSKSGHGNHTWPLLDTIPSYIYNRYPRLHFLDYDKSCTQLFSGVPAGRDLWQLIMRANFFAALLCVATSLLTTYIDAMAAYVHVTYG